MNTGAKELDAILEELHELKLPRMADELQAQFNQPEFVNIGRLELLSTVVHAEYSAAMENRYSARLKKAKLKGTSCSLDLCVDSKDRQYQPADIISVLSTLNFIRSGMNLCVFGASDSGKTYLAKALGAEACREFRVAYYHCEDLAGDLGSIRTDDYSKYKKKLQALAKLDLVILDDFLLHPMTKSVEVKVLYDILERRNELSRSCIICSQRDPKAWPSMLLEDEVSSNSLLKRVTKHYTVFIERKVA